MMFDITVVGSGVVGCAMALHLAHTTSYRIALVDRVVPNEEHSPSAMDDPERFDARVVALTPASIQLLESLEVWPAIAEDRRCPYRNMTVWDNDGTARIQFDSEALQVDALGTIVEQNQLLAGLVQQVNYSSQIVPFWGEPVKNLSLHADTQTIKLKTQSIESKLVIAADGASSAVRALAGFNVQEKSYAQQGIVATVSTELRHQHTAWQNFLSSGPLAFLPLAHPSEQYCSIVWSADDALADELMNLSDADFNHALTRAFQHTLGNVTLADQRYAFPLRQMHCPDYYKPGCVLIGDAAHVIHPLAGQGVNLGLLDVVELSQQIQYASSRELSVNEPSILARYQRARKPHNLQVMKTMSVFKTLFGQTALPIRLIRNIGLRQVDQRPELKHWLAKQAMGL